jgi:cob(I)alamin adenosyltransferase
MISKKGIPMEDEKLIRSISTSAGDKGRSQNYSKEILPKTDLLFEALGSMDELSRFLGLTYHYSKAVEILNIQRILQSINSLLATNSSSDPERYARLTKVTQTDIDWIESIGEAMLQKQPLEPRFVLPGSETSLAGAYFDVSRATSRRCERAVIRFAESKKRQDLEMPLVFLNRLSDLLFLFARQSH